MDETQGTTPNPPSESPQAPPPPPPAYRARGGCNCERCTRRGLMGPAILITVGLIFMVGQFSHRYGFGELWPLILIVIGAVKLLESTGSTEGHRS